MLPFLETIFIIYIMSIDSGKKCTKCKEFFGSPKHGLCSTCHDDWLAETVPDRYKRRNPNLVISFLLSDKDNLGVSSSLLNQFVTLIKNHDYRPSHFMKMLIRTGIIDSDYKPLKFLTAKQAITLMDEREKHVGDNGKNWVWHHVICCNVADYWNIPASFKVAHCYYSDWGMPPVLDDDLDKCRERIYERGVSKIAFAKGQIQYQ